MNRVILMAIVLITVTPLLNAQSVEGRLVYNGEPIPFAHVYLDKAQQGTATDAHGGFILNATPGKHVLHVSAIGYRDPAKPIFVEVGTLSLGDMSVESSVLGLQEVVVSGTLKERSISESPVKVEIVTPEFLQKNGSTDLVRGITMVNGVNEAVACGVCFTNSININGLQGPYTAILIDGMPMFGNLASVYGLNGIPTTMVERIEVIKGPASTLFGSEAMAGVINVITKTPQKMAPLALDVQGNFPHNELFVNASSGFKIGKVHAAIGGNYTFINRFEDENKDGFSDIVNMDRISLFGRISVPRKNYKRFNLAARYYYEDRRNGVESFLTDRAYQQLRGNDSIYGESIYTERIETFGTYDLPVNERIWLDFSFNWHTQDSYYGSDFYNATQGIGYLQSVWNRVFGAHDVTGGITLRYQYYDDNTVATETSLGNGADHSFIPGLFVQNEWRMHKRFTALSGLRLDHYHEHGFIASPRLSLKYEPALGSIVRLSFGTGFRVVNLFTEDHAFVSGNRQVLILEELKPERSYNVNLNFNRVMALGKTQLMLDIDGFFTFFTNAIIPNYDAPGFIIYDNTDGHLINYGTGFTVTQEFQFPLSYTVGVTIQDSREVTTDSIGSAVRTWVPFAASWSGVATVSCNWRKAGLRFDYTVRATGPMALPEVFDVDPATGNPVATPRPTISNTFFIHNIQLTKQLPHNFEIYSGVANLFNYRQPVSPLVAYNDPNAQPGFSNLFDTSYAYAPMHGREFFVGVRWHLSRKQGQ